MFIGDKDWFRVNTKAKGSVHLVYSHGPRATGPGDCSQYMDEEARSLVSKQLCLASPRCPNPAQQKVNYKSRQAPENDG